MTPLLEQEMPSMICLMQSHDYMKDFAHFSLPNVLVKTKRSQRAVYLAMLLLARPEDGQLVCDASHAEIASLAGLDRQTEVAATRDLVGLGLIEILGDGFDRVAEIRSSSETQRVLARRFGVTQGHIARIRKGQYWQGVGEPVEAGGCPPASPEPDGEDLCAEPSRDRHPIAAQTSPRAVLAVA
jgi:hypothetical protein